MSYFDDNESSPAIELWGDRVSSYIDGQEGVGTLRSRIQPNPALRDEAGMTVLVGVHR